MPEIRPQHLPRGPCGMLGRLYKAMKQGSVNRVFRERSHVLYSGMTKKWITKAGILPWTMRLQQREILVMQPVAKHADLPPPPWQLCKGTRMVNEKGVWRDIKKGDDDALDKGILVPESLESTALREAQEEVGLIADFVVELRDCGVVEFTSARSGKTKHMQFFTAFIKSPESALLPEEKVADTTASRRWMSVEEFLTIGRADHAKIVTRLPTLNILPTLKTS